MGYWGGRVLMRTEMARVRVRVVPKVIWQILNIKSWVCPIYDIAETVRLQFKFQMLKALLILLLLTAVSPLAFMTISPQVQTLFAPSEYLLEVYSTEPLPLGTTFTIDFSSTYIQVPNGTLNMTVTLNTLNSNPINNGTVSCLNKVCNIDPKIFLPSQQAMIMGIGNLINPSFQFQQNISVKMFYNTVLKSTYALKIIQSQYTPLSITVNSMNQSDYGVGNTNVTYTFNLSVPMTPANPQISITIPNEIKMSSSPVTLTFFDTIQNVPVADKKIILYQITKTQTLTPGIIFLTIGGLINVPTMGNSSSFNIQLQMATTSTGGSCSGCIIAQISNNLFGQSKFTGDILIVQSKASNSLIGQSNNMTFINTILANIPIGGKYQISLPPQVQPAFPITCKNIFGFKIQPLNGVPSCSYNSTNHAIYTNNFHLPSSGSTVIQIMVINPPDTRIVKFSFQTFGAAGNIISNSSQSLSFKATPLPLIATAPKNISEVSSAFRITVNLTLGVALTPQDTIQVVLPQASYITSGITCISGVSIPCTTAIDLASNNLTITLSPPCSNCAVNSALTFTIDGLNNPSYVNSYSQSIIVRTAHPQGIVQQLLMSITLAASTVSVSNYLRTGTTSVGKPYSMSFTVSIPPYLNTNGGQLLLKFMQDDSYTSVTHTSSNYIYPSSLTIKDKAGVAYTNFLNYYTNTSNAPKSVHQITINICGTSPCSGEFVIEGLVRGFYPLATMTQTFELVTQTQATVAIGSISAQNYTAVKGAHTLGISLSNSVTTLNGNYNLSFISDKVPVSGTLRFSLSSLHKINGGCMGAQNSTLFTGILRCTVINSTSISMLIQGDTTPMMLEVIEYTITITNVINPATIQPLTYSIETLFNQQPSQIFSLTYAIQNPLPLSLSYSRSNSTYSQPSQLTLALTTSYSNFDQIKLIIPTQLMTVSSNPNYLTNINVLSNSFQITNIYSLSNNTLTIDIVNPPSTAVTGQIVFSMYLGAFLSAEGTIGVGTVGPVFLGVGVTSSNSTVGSVTELKVQINRVHAFSAETQFLMDISPTLMDLTNALYNGSPLTLPLTLPISTSTVVITNATNLLSIPTTPPSFAINVHSLDSNNNKVAQSNYNTTSLAANTPAQGISYSFIRSNTAISGVGSLTVSYNPRFPSVASSLNIILPSLQMTLNSAACQIQSTSLTSCQILSSSASAISVSYQNQSKTILTDVVNLQPNLNYLVVEVFNSQGELVERSGAGVTPAIKLDQLMVLGTTSSTVVASQALLTLTMVSYAPVASTSKIVIDLPVGTYSSINTINTPACSYTIAHTTYSGCQYTIDSNGWLTQINITNLGTTTIPGNTTINFTTTLTNGWTSSPFASQIIKVQVSSIDNSFLSHGQLLLSVLNQASSFSTAGVGQLKVMQLSSQAGSSNNLTVSFELPVPAPANTNIELLLPKSSYILNTATVQTIPAPSSVTETSTHYKFIFPSSCSQTVPLCSLANAKFTLSVIVKNQQYLQLNQNGVGVQFLVGFNPLSSPATFSVPLHTAIAITNPSIGRSKTQAYQPTNLTLTVSHPGLTTFSILIAPMVTPSGSISILNPVTFAGITSSQSLSHNISQGVITVDLSGLSTSTTTITLEGTNPFLVPSSTEKYLVTIKDTSFIYFQSIVTPTDTLIPFSTGINLQRIITTVTQSTSVYLNGQLPSPISTMEVTFNNQNYTISGSTFNISLGNTINPQNIKDNTTIPIAIRNTDFVAFSTNLPFTPLLTPKNLTAFASLNIPSTLTVSQTTNLSVSLTNYTISTLELVLPPFFNTVNHCCINSPCTSTNIASCGVTTSSGQNTITLILNNPQAVTSFLTTVKVDDYQGKFVNASVQIGTGLPSARFDTLISLVVKPLVLTSTLTLGSWLVNAVNDYTLYVQPKAQTGYLGITLPTYIITQLTTVQSSTYQLSINGTNQILTISSTNPHSLTIPVTPTTTNITLTLTNIKNPMNSQPFTLTVEQSLGSAFTQIYGRQILPIAMKEFDLISVASVVRNETKVALSVDVTLDITCPNYSDQMVIYFPTSQLTTNGSCSIMANGQSLTCTVLNSSAIITQNVINQAIYTVKGMLNQLSYSSVTQHDLVHITLGLPYTRASTLPSTTTFVSPKLTLGTITLLSLNSTSTTRLNPSTLTYNITIQNTNNINALVTSYQPYAYLMPSTLTCTLNKQPTNCTTLAPQSLIISLPTSPTTNNLLLQIKGIINFVTATNWTMRSVQKLNTIPETYSDVDVYSSLNSGLTSMQSNSLALRVIFPNNYAQNSASPVIVLIDTNYAHLPLTLSQFRLNVTIPQGNCQAVSSNYQSSMTLSCVFNNPTNALLSVTLYHFNHPSIALASSTHSIPILATPTSNCNNQQCDSCSNYNGQQYCFFCRQGLRSSNGQCVEDCPSGTFSYGSANICQQCYPACGSCFGYTKTECLSCQDVSLVLDSGTCGAYCPIGSFSFKRNCVQEQECTGVSGCRVCSGSGFCYECLPDYDGEPVCSYSSPLPPVLMIYIIAPFALLAIISIIIAAAKCGGADSVLSQTIFSFSFLELIAWILTVPIMPDIFTSMVLLSFVALRFIISIVSYEVFYRHNLGELSQKLLEDESNKQSQKSEKKEEENSLDNWKTKLARFMAHFNGPDAYELLKSRIAEPVLSVSHHFAVHILFMVNRWIVGVLMVYLLTVSTFGDSVIMPVVVIACATVVSVGRLFSWDKFRSCFHRCRAS